MQALQDPLELRDLGLELPPDLGVEIVGVDIAAVSHAVAEPGVDQLDSEPLHQQYDVVIHRRYAGGHRDVEGDGTAVILAHVHRDRIPPDPVLSLEQPEVEPVRMVVQPPGGGQPGDTPTDNCDTPRHKPAQSWGRSSVIPMSSTFIDSAGRMASRTSIPATVNRLWNTVTPASIRGAAVSSYVGPIVTSAVRL